MSRDLELAGKLGWACEWRARAGLQERVWPWTGWMSLRQILACPGQLDYQARSRRPSCATLVSRRDGAARAGVEGATRGFGVPSRAELCSRALDVKCCGEIVKQGRGQTVGLGLKLANKEKPLRTVLFDFLSHGIYFIFFVLFYCIGFGINIWTDLVC